MEIQRPFSRWVLRLRCVPLHRRGSCCVIAPGMRELGPGFPIECAGAGRDSTRSPTVTLRVRIALGRVPYPAGHPLSPRAVHANPSPLLPKMDNDRRHSYEKKSGFLHMPSSFGPVPTVSVRLPPRMSGTSRAPPSPRLLSDRGWILIVELLGRLNSTGFSRPSPLSLLGGLGSWANGAREGMIRLVEARRRKIWTSPRERARRRCPAPGCSVAKMAEGCALGSGWSPSPSGHGPVIRSVEENSRDLPEGYLVGGSREATGLTALGRRGIPRRDGGDCFRQQLL